MNSTTIVDREAEIRRAFENGIEPEQPKTTPAKQVPPQPNAVVEVEPELAETDEDETPASAKKVHEQCRVRTHTGRHFCLYDWMAAIYFSHHNRQRPIRVGRRSGAPHCGLTEEQFRLSLAALIADRWIEVVKKPNKENGRGGSGKYRPLTHDEWTAANGFNQCLHRPHTKYDAK